MNQTAPLTAREIRDEVHKAALLVKNAHSMLAKGQVVDLSELEGKVIAICEAINQASGEGLSDLEEPIAAIINDLVSLKAR